MSYTNTKFSFEHISQITENRPIWKKTVGFKSLHKRSAEVVNLDKTLCGKKASLIKLIYSCINKTLS